MLTPLPPPQGRLTVRWVNQVAGRQGTALSSTATLNRAL